MKDQIAAISCGIVNGKALLDLDYSEDSNAEVDANFVMTETDKIVEIQASGEQNSFNYEEFLKMYGLASIGVKELIKKQKEALNIQ